MSRVFKFGGASIKDAEAVRNMASIVRNEIRQNELLVIVVSAMGKTTNALEDLLWSVIDNSNYQEKLDTIRDFHSNIINELDFQIVDKVVSKCDSIFEELHKAIDDVISNEQYSEAKKYDMIVPYGEILSSTIINEYLNENEISISFLDARKLIKTSDDFREGIINWEESERNLIELAATEGNFITQGFIGSNSKNETTTLGREGSDFTAAIFGSALNSESVTIWKDVPGILNADPKLFTNTLLFGSLSYSEASEMTYYGASVIHPKTIKPIANKKIPMHVRSFLKPANRGTIISEERSKKVLPVFILKRNQTLLSFKVKDFTFINEEQISSIFQALNQNLIKINVMQNSAISLTIAIDTRNDKIFRLKKDLEDKFNISEQVELSLITIINHQDDSIKEIESKYDILLEQRSLNTCQYLVAGELGLNIA